MARFQRKTKLPLRNVTTRAEKLGGEWRVKVVYTRPRGQQRNTVNIQVAERCRRSSWFVNPKKIHNVYSRTGLAREFRTGRLLKFCTWACTNRQETEVNLENNFFLGGCDIFTKRNGALKLLKVTGSFLALSYWTYAVSNHTFINLSITDG